jgi:allantoate deiminase
MDRLGMMVRVDGVGNLRGVYEGTDPSQGRLLIGSHLDTVPDAGAFDGVLGVVLGIALIEALKGERLPFAVEVIGFSEEEGVRFGLPFIGSRAVVGAIDRGILKRVDRSGISVRQAIEKFGLGPVNTDNALLDPSSKAYLEFHIEQGPVLEHLGLPLGIVREIAGQTRAEVSFWGQANHAGTTPMQLRRDALCGAAEWIISVERIARETEGLVATVGKIDALPGASNAVPGTAVLALDVRHAADAPRLLAYEQVLAEANRIADKRGLSLQSNLVLDQSAVAMDETLTALLERAMRAVGISSHRMTSGAGHDAMIVARKLPSAMVFLRSPGGLSHHPDEAVFAGDVALALSAGLNFFEEFSACVSVR